MIKMKDSRGNKSSLLGFTTIGFLVGTLAFIYSTYFNHTADLTNYGIFLSTCLAPYLAREYTEKVKKDT